MPRRTGSGARSGTNLDASSVAMASKATQSAMDVASSSLVRSLLAALKVQSMLRALTLPRTTFY